MNIEITMEKTFVEQVKYDIKMLVPMYAFSACVLNQAHGREKKGIEN